MPGCDNHLLGREEQSSLITSIGADAQLVSTPHPAQHYVYLCTGGYDSCKHLCWLSSTDESLKSLLIQLACLAAFPIWSCTVAAEATTPEKKRWQGCSGCCLLFGWTALSQQTAGSPTTSPCVQLTERQVAGSASHRQICFHFILSLSSFPVLLPGCFSLPITRSPLEDKGGERVRTLESEDFPARVTARLASSWERMEKSAWEGGSQGWQKSLGWSWYWMAAWLIAFGKSVNNG